VSRPLRVAIAGARGIGKHHAKWFAHAGCEVVAIYGTTETSANTAAVALRNAFGFDGRAFSDWDRFRKEGGFDVCSVCSPAESHYANVRDLAADGKHILCEKPLVWNWDYTPLRILEEASCLVEAAAHHGVILGMNAQYPAILEGWLALHREVVGREPDLSELHFIMASKGAPRSPHGAAEVWVDLGPHPLAFLDGVAHGGVDWSTLRHTDGPHEVVLDFDWRSPTGDIRVHIECRRITDSPVIRRVGNREFSADYEGCSVEGEFAARLRSGEREWIGKDLMRVSVERFVDAVRTSDPSRVLVDGRSALRQQEALTEVWSHCWPSATTP
jgi:predicted dehydrogenase